jgi:hypothetical protein
MGFEPTPSNFKALITTIFCFVSPKPEVIFYISENVEAPCLENSAVILS